MPEPGSGDMHLGLAGIEDVRRLAGSIDVHDRSHHGADERGSIEGDCSLEPFGVWNVTTSPGRTPEATGPRRLRRGKVQNVTERAAPGTRLRMNHERQVSVSRQPVEHALANALIAPPALGDESAAVLGVDLSQGPCGVPISSASTSPLRRARPSPGRTHISH